MKHSCICILTNATVNASLHPAAVGMFSFHQPFPVHAFASRSLNISCWKFELTFKCTSLFILNKNCWNVSKWIARKRERAREYFVFHAKTSIAISQFVSQSLRAKRFLHIAYISFYNICIFPCSFLFVYSFCLSFCLCARCSRSCAVEFAPSALAVSQYRPTSFPLSFLSYVPWYI